MGPNIKGGNNVVGKRTRYARKFKLKETEPENSHVALRMK
jgi:hypothetical protein